MWSPALISRSLWLLLFGNRELYMGVVPGERFLERRELPKRFRTRGRIISDQDSANMEATIRRLSKSIIFTFADHKRPDGNGTDTDTAAAWTVGSGVWGVRPGSINAFTFIKITVAELRTLLNGKAGGAERHLARFDVAIMVSLDVGELGRSTRDI